MRTCSYCGKTYTDDATICPIDGYSLATKPALTTKSTLPVDEQQKKWIEDKFRWLLSEFGDDYFLRKKIILPEASFFPDKYDGTEESVLPLVRRICSYMDIDSDTIEVVYLVDRDDTVSKHRLGGENYSGAAGLYFSNSSRQEKARIAINVSALKNPTTLVGTIAHELCHVLLLGGRKISRDNEDHEYITDLLTVFLGFGIFTANSVFQFSQWQDHSHHGWSASRIGYLSEEMFAYSLALYAWIRGETKPKWSGHLAMNVQSYFKQCLKHLDKNGPTGLRRLVPNS